LNTTQSIECFVNPDGNSIESFANGANAQLGNSMQSWMDEGTVSKGKIPHVINIDFANTFVTDACLAMSRMNLE